MSEASPPSVAWDRAAANPCSSLAESAVVPSRAESIAPVSSPKSTVSLNPYKIENILDSVHNNQNSSPKYLKLSLFCVNQAFITNCR